MYSQAVFEYLCAPRQTPNQNRSHNAHPYKLNSIFFFVAFLCQNVCEPSVLNQSHFQWAETTRKLCFSESFDLISISLGTKVEQRTTSAKRSCNRICLPNE